MTDNSRWPEEKEQLLETLWAAGLSASQIAHRLADGTSRSAVVGKVHRLGLPGRLCSRTHSARKTKKAKDTLYRTSPPITVPVASPCLPILKALVDEMKQAIKEDEPSREGIPHEALTPAVCQWPINDGSPWRFCGDKKIPGSSYCRDHHERSTNGKVKYHTPIVSNREMAA